MIPILQILNNHLLQTLPELQDWPADQHGDIATTYHHPTKSRANAQNPRISIEPIDETNIKLTLTNPEPQAEHLFWVRHTTTRYDLQDPTSVQTIEQQIQQFIKAHDPVQQLKNTMNTNDLIPTQAGLRLPSHEFQQMLQHAHNHHFNHEALQTHNPARTTLIAIMRIMRVPQTTQDLPAIDGYHYFIRDGLHRCIAIHIARPGQTLHPDEYTIENRTIHELETPNIATGWVTPINPIIHVRLPEFHTYKQQLQQQPNPHQLTYIHQHQHQYRITRTPHHTIQQIAKHH